MANHSATKKSIRKIARRTAHRKSVRSALKTTVRHFTESLSAGDKDKATEAFKDVQSKMMKAAQRNLVHKKTVARKLSRLSKQFKTSF